MLVYRIKGVKQRSRREKMLIDREKMLVLPFRKAALQLRLSPESNREETKSLQL
jgi:hypothetical protein